MGIFRFFGEIADSLDRRSDISDVMFDVKYAKEKRQREKLAKKLHDFKSADELPLNTLLLLDMIKTYRAEGDADRAFICAKKLGDFSVSCKNIVAYYYMNGYGTEKNEELACKYLTDFLVEMTIRFDPIYNLDKAWNGVAGFVYPEAQKAAAEVLISEKKRPFGVFLLEDALLALSNNVPANATAEQITEIYTNISDNPYAKYRLWLAGGKKDDELLHQSARGGCYFAAEHLKDKPMMEKLQAEAKSIIEEGYEYALNIIQAKISHTNMAYFLFTEGVKEFERGENSLDNPALVKIDEAVALGNQQALLWSAQKKSRLGDSRGEALMAQIYLEGLYGVEKDIDRGVLLLMRSSGKGNPEGQYRWAQVLEKGLYNIPADTEQAVSLYTKSAKQGNLYACIRLAQWYSQGEQLNADIVYGYLTPVLSLSKNTDENKALVRNAYFILMQMNRGYKYHIAVYDELEQAFDCAAEIARIDLENSEDSYIQNVINDLNRTKYIAKDVHQLSNHYYFHLKETSDDDVYAVYETLVLWYIRLKEEMAKHGDVDSMIGLYNEYSYVGSYVISDFKYASSGKTIKFAGNHERRVYWLEKAIEAGDVVAIRTKGEDWKRLGLTESEGTMWLRKAQSMGDSIAADTIHINAMEKKKRAEFEENIREYLKSEQNSSASDNDKKNIEAVYSVHSMPAVITGPYNNKYVRIVISAFSAEYQGEHGDIVTIENSDIGIIGRSAKTAAGYFYW